MSYLGDFRLGDTFDVKFTTVNTSGLPTTVVGLAVAAYPGNAVTGLTAGITVTVDFGTPTRVGLHNVRVVGTGANGYALATNYALVVTAGTVAGTSIVGYTIAHFSIEARVVAAVTGSVGSVITPMTVNALGPQAKLDVNAEVVDALTVDTYPEPAVAPPATASLAAKINWQQMLARNRVNQSNAAQQVRNDADTVDVATAPVADVGGIVTRGKFV